MEFDNYGNYWSSICSNRKDIINLIENTLNQNKKKTIKNELVLSNEIIKLKNEIETKRENKNRKSNYSKKEEEKKNENLLKNIKKNKEENKYTENIIKDNEIKNEKTLFTTINSKNDNFEDINHEERSKDKKQMEFPMENPTDVKNDSIEYNEEIKEAANLIKPKKPHKPHYNAKRNNEIPLVEKSIENFDLNKPQIVPQSLLTEKKKENSTETQNPKDSMNEKTFQSPSFEISPENEMNQTDVIKTIKEKSSFIKKTDPNSLVDKIMKTQPNEEINEIIDINLDKHLISKEELKEIKDKKDGLIEQKTKQLKPLNNNQLLNKKIIQSNHKENNNLNNQNSNFKPVLNDNISLSLVNSDNSENNIENKSSDKKNYEEEDHLEPNIKENPDKNEINNNSICNFENSPEKKNKVLLHEYSSEENNLDLSKSEKIKKNEVSEENYELSNSIKSEISHNHFEPKNNKDIEISPLETYIEVIDSKNDHHIVPQSLLNQMKKENETGMITLQDEITGKKFEVCFDKINTDNEMNHIYFLKTIKGKHVPVRKMYLKSLIDKRLKCQPIDEKIEIMDINFNRHLISKDQITNLIYNSRLAECILLNSFSNSDFLEIFDLQGNRYILQKKSLINIFEKIKNNQPPSNKEMFITKNGEPIKLNPFSLRHYNTKAVSNQIKEGSLLKSISQNSSFSSKNRNSNAKSLNTLSSHSKLPYSYIDEENNSYFEVTNLKSCKKDLLSKKEILSYIVSKTKVMNDEYNKDECKLILNKNNSQNEFIKAPTNQYILKHQFNDLLNLLFSNQKIPEFITVKSLNNENIKIEVKSLLISLFEISPSPYMKDEILHKDEITYYYIPQKNKFIEKRSPSIFDYFTKNELNEPGIEMLEFIKAEDIQGIPIYIRKPFIRNQLYNGNISSNIEITDFENHKRIISIISIISKYSKGDISTNSNSRINEPIPNSMIFYEVVEEGNESIHLTSKDKIKIGNKKLKEENNINGINLIDIKGRAFSAKIDNNKKKIVLLNQRQWIEIEDENGETIYVYKSIIRHLLDEDDENMVSCYRPVTTLTNKSINFNNIFQKEKEEVNRLDTWEDKGISFDQEEEEDFVYVIDYYCKKRRINRKTLRVLISEQYNNDGYQGISNSSGKKKQKNNVIIQQTLMKSE